MSSIEEVRRWLLGKNIEGLPDRTKWGKPSIKRKKAKAKVGEINEVTIGDLKIKDFEDDFEIIEHHYKVATHGGDAILLFGKHRGKLLSTVIKKDPKYTKWMQKNCCDEFKNLIEHQLTKAHSKLYPEDIKVADSFALEGLGERLKKAVKSGKELKATFGEIGSPTSSLIDVFRSIGSASHIERRTLPSLSSGSVGIKIDSDLSVSSVKNPFAILRDGTESDGI